jgi:hypothetical protein
MGLDGKFAALSSAALALLVVINTHAPSNVPSAVLSAKRRLARDANWKASVLAKRRTCGLIIVLKLLITD